LTTKLISILNIYGVSFINYNLAIYIGCQKRENGKKVYRWQPMLRRPLGRPKNRLEDDIRIGVKKLKIKNWTNCIQDRKNWKLYVGKAKTFKD
jgi:hypothetical protein